MEQRFIIRYLKGETTAEERVKMLEWLEADSSHLEEFKCLRKMFDAAVCSETIGVEQKQTHSRMARPVFFRRWTTAAAVAAVFCIFVCGIAFYAHSLKERQDVMLAASTVYVPVGQRTEITLNDGTKVWLNSNTSLCIGRQDGKTRYVSIDGEAYFDVAHNADIPFVVKAGDREVRVLGTKFSVLSYLDGNDFSVRLYEGSVDVNDSSTMQTVRLAPSEEVRLASDGRMVKSGFDGTDSLLWLDGIYNFEDMDYGQIFNRIKEYYKVEFEVRNPDVLKYRCTCKFWEEDGLLHIIDVLQGIHHFDYEWDGDKRVVIIL